MAKQRDMDAAHVLMACYRGRIKDALLKAIEVIKFARGEKDTEIVIKGLDQEPEEDMGGAAKADQLGKVPLALQQIALASERANTQGNKKLVSALNQKSAELTKGLAQESDA